MKKENKNLSKNNIIDKVHNVEKFNKAIILFAIAISTTLQIVLIFNDSLWLDEAFTMLTVNKNFSDFWQFIVVDVHPPLYYIIIRAIFYITGSSLQVAKLVSMMPIVLLNLIIANFIFKDENKIKSKKDVFLFILFIAATMITYSFLHIAVEVRMYSWAMFFVTISGIYAYKVYQSMAKKDILIFVLVSLGAAFTHYFALIMEVIIYFYLFLMLIIKSRKNIKSIVRMAGITILGYMWWLPTALEQVRRVKLDYWITFEMKDIQEYFNIIFDFNWIVTIILLVVILLACLYKLCVKKDLKGKEKEEMAFGTFCITMPIIVIIVGMILNVIIRPIFIARYLTPSLALLWMGIIILIKYVDYRNIIKSLVRSFGFGYVYNSISYCI